MDAQFQMLPLSDLVESELNPRREFDAERLAELVESVRTKGVLEPLLVRPLPKGGWEVAAGARRFRAARAAGLKQVPAMVREMSDAELLEVAILENVVRANISALEEGDAYRLLVEEHGYTVEQLTEKTGKSRTIVFQRMKLAGLQGPLRQLVNEGKLSASVAELLARLPTPSMQEAALAVLRKEAHYKFQGPDGDLSLLPYRDAKELLDGEFRLKLKEAPFDTKSLDLVSLAGACVACTKRTGASKELFPGIKDDTCLDSACWAKKKNAAFKALQAELAEDGKKLVKEKRVFEERYDGTQVLVPAEKYSKPTESVLGKESWKDLLGKEVPIVTVLDERDNSTHNLVDRKAALARLREKDAAKAAKLEQALAEPPKEDWRAKQEEAVAARRQEQLVARLAAGETVRALAKKPLDVTIELLVAAAAARTWQWKDLCALAGLKADAKLKPAERRLALVALALQLAEDGANNTVLADAAKAAKVDLKALRKKVKGAQPGTCLGCGATGEKVAWNATYGEQLYCEGC